MELEEAQGIVRNLLDTAVNDSVTLAQRIDELKTDYAADPYITTEAMIRKLEARRIKKIREANALALVVATF